MILVFGKSGQLASELAEYPGVMCLGRESADFKHPGSCKEVILKYKPKAIINAAAYTSVDSAELNEAEAYTINSEAPAIISRTCFELGIPLLHISTDYVFSGTGIKPWTERDQAKPINIYGKSKLMGETAVISCNPLTTVLRTSWVYSKYGSNFLKTILALSNEKSEINVVNDQFGAPTSAKELARACLFVLQETIKQPKIHGIYHFCGDKNLNWASFARLILKIAKKDTIVLPYSSKCLGAVAKRPKNSRLDTTLFYNQFNFKHASIKKCLHQTLAELNNN